MKNTVKYILHKLFGFRNYLFIFSLFKIKTLKRDSKEKDFFEFLRHIPENTAVLDIGANIGIMTVHLAGIRGSMVYAFEPMPNNILAFKRIVNHFKLKNVKLFENLERIRIKTRTSLNFTPEQRLLAKVDYDHQAIIGSFVGRGDFRQDRKSIEDSQHADLSQTIVEEKGAFYEHRLYRASLAYQSEFADLEIGRQQIPWGVGYFFTPTDLLTPYNALQVEPDERQGADAVYLTKKIKKTKTQFVYAPGGKRLHPRRGIGRISGDIGDYESGLMVGFVKNDYVIGLDTRGYIKESAVRGEILYQGARHEKDFVKLTVNADYNFPHNIYGILEYYYNGQGRRRRRDYQTDRSALGEIQQLGKNYLAFSLNQNITPLLRLENSAIVNLDDISYFINPQIEYSIKPNVVFTCGAHIFAGGKHDELGEGKNLYLSEIKYSF